MKPIMEPKEPNNKLITLPGSLENHTKWIETRDKLLGDARQIESVSSGNDLEVSGAIQTRIQKHIKQLAKHRLELTRPIDALKKQIMTQEKAMKAELDKELQRLKKLNDAYATAEYERQERERIAAEEELTRQIMESNAQQQQAEDVFGVGVEFNPNFTPPIELPTVEKPKATNNRTVIRWTFEIVNPAKVPDQFKSVDTQKITAYIKYAKNINQTPEIPGVIFSKHVSVEAR